MPNKEEIKAVIVFFALALAITAIAVQKAHALGILR